MFMADDVAGGQVGILCGLLDKSATEDFIADDTFSGVAGVDY